ncbi:MAG: Mrp/NBP35 family ATP-binding protein [Deltaproteobacteria bacterium]|nr:Mrp/NBP35 family ATP-binding protein [Deltaproteobacteria bacterium]
MDDGEQRDFQTLTPGDRERLEQDDAIRARLSGIRRKILVMSGKGGVGKSTVAAYCALLLGRRGRRVGILDVDLHGPSIPRLLNVQGGPEVIGANSVRPCFLSDNLRVLSMDLLLGDRDRSIIWRGPMKIGAIRQFLSDVEWGELDYLIMDCPPGTGDEPLSVAQSVPDAEALIVTTPQEIALADVRRSIRFCSEVGMRVLGLVENMSGFVCPGCGKEVFLFGAGGGVKTAERMGISVLGSIPVSTEMVRFGDQGDLASLAERKDLEINDAYGRILDRVEEGIDKAVPSE